MYVTSKALLNVCRHWRFWWNCNLWIFFFCLHNYATRFYESPKLMLLKWLQMSSATESSTVNCSMERIYYLLSYVFIIETFTMYCIILNLSHWTWAISHVNLQSELFGLTHFLIQTHFEASAADNYWKLSDKRRICSLLAVISFATMLSTVLKTYHHDQYCWSYWFYVIVISTVSIFTKIMFQSIY